MGDVSWWTIISAPSLAILVSAVLVLSYGLNQRQTESQRLTNAILTRLPSAWITKARFPFKSNRLLCVRCVNENRKKRKRLRWQAANHGRHCFDRTFLLAGAYASVKFSRNKRMRQPIGMLSRSSGNMIGCLPTQAIAFERKRKPGLKTCMCVCLRVPNRTAIADTAVRMLKCSNRSACYDDALHKSTTYLLIYLWINSCKMTIKEHNKHKSKWNCKTSRDIADFLQDAFITNISTVTLTYKKYVLWNAGICPIASKVGHVTLATPLWGHSSSLYYYYYWIIIM